MAAPTNVYTLDTVPIGNINAGPGGPGEISGSGGSRQGTYLVPTGSTGVSGDVYVIPAWAGTGIGITVQASSTAVVTVQATTDSLYAVQQGTAIWANLGAPFAGVTSGAIAQGSVNYAITALQITVGTALAGNNATIAIRTASPRA